MKLAVRLAVALALLVVAVVIWQNKKPALLNNQGVQLIEAGRYEEAVRVLEKARAAKPHDPRILRNLADAYDGSNRLREALEAFEASHALVPLDYESALRMEEIRAELSRAPVPGVP